MPMAVTELPQTCVYTFMNFLYLQVMSMVRSPFQKETTILLEPATCINEQIRRIVLLMSLTILHILQCWVQQEHNNKDSECKIFSQTTKPNQTKYTTDCNYQKPTSYYLLFTSCDTIMISCHSQLINKNIKLLCHASCT